MLSTAVRFSKGRACLALTCAMASLWIEPCRAGLIFSDAFSYATGSLSGNNGGTGWSGSWSGGSSTVAGALPGAGGTSVRISDNASVTSRQMTSPIITGLPTTYYLSVVFNANPFPPSGGGDYAGVSLVGTGTSSASLFLGTPGSSGQLGFDWANEGDGLWAASNNTNYLTVLAIAPGPSAGRTVVSLYTSPNLLISGTALVSGTALASIEADNFSFGAVEIAGGYTSTSISIAGLALATTVDEAVGFTQIAVPEPGSPLVLGPLAATLGGWGLRRIRRRACAQDAIV